MAVIFAATLFNTGILEQNLWPILRHYTPNAWKILIFPVEINHNEQQRLKKNYGYKHGYKPPGHENAKRTKLLKELKRLKILQDSNQEVTFLHVQTLRSPGWPPWKPKNKMLKVLD